MDHTVSGAAEQQAAVVSAAGVVPSNEDDPLPPESAAPGFDTPEIIFRPVASLREYAKNARTHSDAQIEQVATSLVEFGWTNPVLEDATGIVAGHARSRAARWLYDNVGCDLHFPDGTPIPFGTVPVLPCDGWSEDKRRAYILADNKLALNAGWDESMLREELLDLQASGFDEVTGFSSAELRDLFKARNPGEYTQAIKTPVYVPTQAEAPPLSALCDRTKMDALIARIDASTLPDDEKAFLRLAAARHAVFDYRNIAEHYAHASPALQRFMEASALVIIDFNKAIENGYVQLSYRLASLFEQLEDDEGGDENERRHAAH